MQESKASENVSSALHGAMTAVTTMDWPLSTPIVGDESVKVSRYCVPIVSRIATPVNVAAPFWYAACTGPLSPLGTVLEGGCDGDVVLRVTRRSGQNSTVCS